MSNDTETNVPDIAQARKLLYDWLDTNRPWARTDRSIYETMEQIVERAARAFRNDRRPSQAEYDRLAAMARKLTRGLKHHPEGYEGPCDCDECRREEF